MSQPPTLCSKTNGGAIVKTTLCGLCGSDLHPYHHDPGIGTFCIGHEAVGEVVEVGNAVRWFKKGDRVLIPGSIGCGKCRPCLAGQVILCQISPPQVYGQGQAGIGGCQADYVHVPAADHNLWTLPNSVSDKVGIMLTDNLATAWFCTRRAKVAPGDEVAVIGLGPVGLQAVASAKAMGASRVFAIDLVAERRQAAIGLGAEAIDGADTIELVRHLTRGRGPDIVLDTNGSEATIAMAVNMVKRGGRVSVVGISETPDIRFPIVNGLAKNLEFYAGLTSVQAELPALFRALEDGRLDGPALEGIITHEMGLSEGPMAYAKFDARHDGIKKVVLDPAR